MARYLGKVIWQGGTWHFDPAFTIKLDLNLKSPGRHSVARQGLRLRLRVGHLSTQAGTVGRATSSLSGLGRSLCLRPLTGVTYG
jgi:hypothetical protein